MSAKTEIKRLRLFLLLLVLLLSTSENLVAENENRPSFLKSLEKYKDNYILRSFFLNNGGNNQGYENNEIKIQFSFKKKIFEKFYFGYSQKSFWQLYDESRSRPFRDQNYNPEFFFQFREKYNFNELRLGIFEHESNGEQTEFNEEGEEANLSRSWNRSYIFGSKKISDHFSLGAKVWIILDQFNNNETENKNDETASYEEDNPDIEDYMGRSELYFSVNTEIINGEVLFRKGFQANTETVRLDLRIPLKVFPGINDEGLDIMIQYFNGFGESLIDYNRKIEKVSIGFAAN